MYNAEAINGIMVLLGTLRDLFISNMKVTNAPHTPTAASSNGRGKASGRTTYNVDNMEGIIT